MKHGPVRFDFYLTRLQELLDKSSKHKNPALWLYQHNARTVLFMLEGLSKLYAGLHNKKKFSKLKEQFKQLEDAIGQIDYYDAFAKAFIQNKKIPATITNYLMAQSREKIQSLNEILKEKNWLGETPFRLAKIRKKLKKADWQDEKEEMKNIQVFYYQAIHTILEFIHEKDFQLTNVEKDLHEFRRMLRWLSIYPQALQGAIQLSSDHTKPPAFLKKYMTTAIVNSPYNVMPDAGIQNIFLLLDKLRFFALSFLIAELGQLKDSGLKIEVIQEAILQTSKKNEKDANLYAGKLAGKGHLTTQQVLDTAEKLIKTYCKEQNLENLITGIAGLQK